MANSPPTQKELFIPYYMEAAGHRIVVRSQKQADELSRMGYKRV